MNKKEHYRRNLPHFHKGGQMFFITSNLKGAISPLTLAEFNDAILFLKTELMKAQKQGAEEKVIAQIKKEIYVERNKRLVAMDDLLAKDETSEVNLNLATNRRIMFDAFRYFEGKRLENHAFCVMRNHFHWVMRLFEKDENNKELFLQDLMKLIHGVSAREINKFENKTGRTVWQGEAFDTSIRDDKHWYNAIQYTINNPVRAGLVKNWWEWKGTWCAFDFQ